MEFQYFKPVYKKGSNQLEEAVNFAHQICKECPWIDYRGGKKTRALVRGRILSKTPDNKHDWKEYFREWVKSGLGINFYNEFIDADGNPIPYTPKTPEQLKDAYERRAKFLNSIQNGVIINESTNNHP
jgi:hypothetical protein